MCLFGWALLRGYWLWHCCLPLCLDKEAGFVPRLYLFPAARDCPGHPRFRAAFTFEEWMAVNPEERSSTCPTTLRSLGVRGREHLACPCPYHGILYLHLADKAVEEKSITSHGCGAGTLHRLKTWVWEVVLRSTRLHKVSVLAEFCLFFFFYYVCGCSEMKIPLGFFLSGLVFLSGWVCASPIILATVVSMGLVT